MTTPHNQLALSNGRARSVSDRERPSGHSDGLSPRYGASDGNDMELPSRDSDSLARTLRDENEDDSDEDDDSPEIIMAADQRGSQMGLAYYTAAESKLCIFEDVGLSPDSFETLKFQVGPTLLLLSLPMGDIERAAREGGEEEIDRPYRVLMPFASEFTYKHGRRKLMALRFGEERGPEIIPPADLRDVSSQERSWEKLLKLSSWIHENSKISVGCAAAVVDYLQSREYHKEGGHRGGPQIQCIEMISMKNVMFVSSDMMCSLQIFENESHPNMDMQGEGGQGREGLSLFGILNCTHSPMGYNLLKQWFLRPSLSIDTIEERQAGVAALMHDGNSDALKELGKSLKRVKNIPKILGQLKMGKGSGRRGGEYASLHEFLVEALNIHSIVQDMVGWRRAPIFTKIMETFDLASIDKLHQDITRIVNFKESAAAGRVVVNFHVDPDMDALKEKSASLETLTVTANALYDSAGLPWYMRQGLATMYHRTYGYLIKVPIEHKRFFRQPTFRYRFNGDGVRYYSHRRLEQLPAPYADVDGQIGDLDSKITHELRVHILSHEDLLVASARVLAELDCLMSFAESAVKNRYNRPRMTEENFLEIRHGRHPLQELCVDGYVPNDCSLAGGRNGDDSEASAQLRQRPSTILLNGPNLSGKTVYLTQVALITYMAHIGSYVPADRAVIGLTDRILTRLQTRESISENQSAFMTELQQIAVALRLVTQRSLIIVDEFDKRMTPANKAGLECAIFEHLTDLPDGKHPKVVASTRYHSVFDWSTLFPHPRLWFGNLSAETTAANETVYHYTLVNGWARESPDVECVSNDVADQAALLRGREIVRLGAQGEDLVEAYMTINEEEAAEVEEAQAIV